MNPEPKANPPRITVVVPVFNEQEVLPALLTRLTGVFDSAPEFSWYAVFVDDGSKDASSKIMAHAETNDPRLKLIQLTRNFGHQAALCAGLAAVAAGTDAVVTMDADLQDPPEFIPQLVKSWREGAEVVLAVRRTRAETGLRRLGFDVFHGAFARMSDFQIPRNTGTFGLMGKSALDAFLSLPERHRFFPGLRAWVGFTQAEILYDRQERAAGTPGQTLRCLVRYAFDGVFSFSNLPLRMVTYAGMLIASCGFVIGLYFIINRLLGTEIAFTGFTTLVTLVLFLGGVQLIGIGVLGEYMGRIYDEVKKRPLYVVKHRNR
jgi:glycosyltransferase involved in cell wall biosynthesis